MLDQESSFYLISLNILIPCLLNDVGYLRKSFMLITPGSLRVNFSHFAVPHSHSYLQHADINFFSLLFFLTGAVYLAKQKGGP